MACLLDPAGNVIFLAHYHVFGRMLNSVDTEIKGAEVSRHHAALEWRDEQWMIKDFSTNGTWVNGVKMPKNQFVALKKGAEIQFGHNASDIFTLVDNKAPVDSLCRCNPDVMAEPTPLDYVLELDTYHMLPDGQTPSTVVYKSNGLWWVEDLREQDHKRALKDRDLLEIDKEYWQFRLAGGCMETVPLSQEEASLEDLCAEFSVSQDEESISLKIIQGTKVQDLKIRNHHYLSLYLCRKRIQDQQSGLASSEQGWVYVEQVSKDLGIEETAVNVHVHRARKQFSQQFKNIADAPNFVERRPSQLRLGLSCCRVLKADKLESQLGLTA